MPTVLRIGGLRPRLDAGLYVPALLQGVFGSKSWMARHLGAQGGRARTVAKIAASRENGRKSGRPKKARDHDVPLSSAALAILEAVKPLRNAERGDFVFPGARLGRPLSNMAMTEVLRRMGHADVVPHGFRSTFRMWCAEATNYPRELAESALAHTVRDKVEAAYQRSTMIEKRRTMMEQWATFCARPSVTAGTVLPMRAVAE